MRRCRVIYGVVLLATGVLAFWSANALLVLTTLVLCLVPPVLRLLILLDVRSIRLSLHTRTGSPIGRPLEVRVRQEHQHLLLATGALTLELQWENLLIGSRCTQEIQLPPVAGDVSFSSELDPRLCGQVRITCLKATCTDLLGLSTVAVALPQEQFTVVYPDRFPVQVTGQEMANTPLQSDQADLQQKGRDISEVFELRSYVPGDDLRFIHWKLSNKSEELLVREGSAPAHSHLALLFDAGRKSEGLEVPPEMLAGAVNLAASLSRCLADWGLAHEVIFSTGQDLVSSTVRDRRSCADVMGNWMSLQVQPDSGLGLQLFAAGQLHHNYSRLIYLTAGIMPADDALPPDLHVTLLCLTEGKALRSYQKGNRQFLELPLDMLKSGGFQIPL